MARGGTLVMLKLAAIFTQDAVEFVGGERFTGSGSCDLIKTLHAKAIRLVWTVQGTDAFAVETHRIRAPAYRRNHRAGSREVACSVSASQTRIA